MFKDRAKFNKFLFIATPIIFGVNLGIVLLKFLGVFVVEGDYAYKMFAFATMHNPPGFMYNMNYSLSGLIYTANIAYGVLSFVALSLIKDDQKHRSLSLAFAIVTFALLTVLMSLGFMIDESQVSYWIVPIWFIVIGYHIAFPLIFFFKYLKLKKQ
jgi:hypothetical protein